MMMNTSFPDKDLCSRVCTNVGGFVKIAKTEHDQHETKDKELPKEKAAALKNQKPDDESIKETLANLPDVDEQYLPKLKPGPDGQVNWTPLADMTGTRPKVTKYSTSRYSLDEWRQHNKKILDPSVIIQANTLSYNAKAGMVRKFGTVDRQQEENTRRLTRKAKDIFRWKSEVEKACSEITKEVELLEIERQRLKGASRTLMLPESISIECLELRSSRAESDLVADMAEQELIKEMNLVSEVRAKLKQTLDEIELQMTQNKAAKHRMEYDWCDKTMAYNTEVTNLSLNPDSKTILFRPGATRFGDYTASVEYWEYFCRESLQNCEAVRQQSENLRSTLNAILVNGGRKLRTQADKTDIALAETVAITQELCTKSEVGLSNTLQKIADIENLIKDLENAVGRMDYAMKLAQTRLDNRNVGRPHGEAVRDHPHIGLIDEVKKIHETVTSLLRQLRNAESIREDLMKKRVMLESDIAAKRKTLNIDRDRCGMVRSHYPSASELAGY